MALVTGIVLFLYLLFDRLLLLVVVYPTAVTVEVSYGDVLPFPCVT